MTLSLLRGDSQKNIFLLSGDRVISNLVGTHINSLDICSRSSILIGLIVLSVLLGVTYVDYHSRLDSLFRMSDFNKHNRYGLILDTILLVVFLIGIMLIYIPMSQVMIPQL